VDSKLKRTFHGHLKGVWCLRFITKNLLCSGSYDCSLKIWNLVNGTCSRTLYSHTGPVWAICTFDKYLVSASKDKTAKVWDISCCTVKFTLVHKEPVYCVDIQDDTVVTGSGNDVLT
jgi:WD40 repeat protein